MKTKEKTEEKTLLINTLPPSPFMRPLPMQEIIEVKAETKRKPAQITITIPNDLAKKIMSQLMHRGFDMPKIRGMRLNWSEEKE